MKKNISRIITIFLTFLISGNLIAANHPIGTPVGTPGNKKNATHDVIHNNNTGSRPTSGAYQSINFIGKSLHRRRPEGSSLTELMEGWNVNLSLSYNTFNDTSLGKGYFRDYSVTLSKDLGNDFYGGFNLFESKFSIGKSNINSKTIGITGFINKDLNENWGIAGFIILGTTDRERRNNNGSLYGGGLIASYHRPLNETIVFSNTTTLSKIFADTGHDTVISNMSSIDYQQNEYLTISPYLTLTDSLRNANNGDTTYWVLGCDFQYQLKNNSFLTLGYERTFALKNLHDNNITLSYDISF